ncbi:hypothetical protein J6590_062349 [Homalodisca vitripennis]|nr:hypothetical protein J6590_062349 [Homalodisca vitripennis]
MSGWSCGQPEAIIYCGVAGAALSLRGHFYTLGLEMSISIQIGHLAIVVAATIYNSRYCNPRTIRQQSGGSCLAPSLRRDGLVPPTSRRTPSHQSLGVLAALRLSPIVGRELSSTQRPAYDGLVPPTSRRTPSHQSLGVLAALRLSPTVGRELSSAQRPAHDGLVPPTSRRTPSHQSLGVLAALRLSVTWDLLIASDTLVSSVIHRRDCIYWLNCSIRRALHHVVAVRGKAWAALRVRSVTEIEYRVGKALRNMIELCAALSRAAGHDTTPLSPDHPALHFHMHRAPTVSFASPPPPQYPSALTTLYFDTSFVVELRSPVSHLIIRSVLVEIVCSSQGSGRRVLRESPPPQYPSALTTLYFDTSFVVELRSPVSHLIIRSVLVESVCSSQGSGRRVLRESPPPQYPSALTTLYFDTSFVVELRSPVSHLILSDTHRIVARFSSGRSFVFASQEVNENDNNK